MHRALTLHHVNDIQLAPFAVSRHQENHQRAGNVL
jgi:hypothetical protein